MSRPLVFVSHSGRTAAHRKQVESLAAALEKQNLEPWIDRERIKTGDRWNDAISAALRRCHGAVVLFTPEALRSEYVRYEVSYLAVRARTEAPAFRLHALLANKLKPESVAQGFYGAIRLDEFQFGTWATLDQDLATLAAACPRDPPLLTPAGELEQLVLEVFKRLPPDLLRTAAHDLGWTDPRTLNLPESTAIAQFFTRQLITQSLSEQIRALARVRAALDQVIDAVRIFEWIAPCWVDEAAAEAFRAARARPPGQRAALVNGSLPGFTPGMFLRRALPGRDPLVAASDPAAATTPPLVSTLPEPAGRQTEAELTHEVAKYLARRLRVPESDIAAELADREADHHEPTVVPLRLDAPDLPALEALLQGPFDRAAFFVLTGPSAPALPVSLQPRVTVLQPELRHDPTSRFHNEAFAYRRYSRRFVDLPDANPTSPRPP